MNEEKVIKKLLDHDEEFERVHQGIDELKKEILSGQDQILTIVQRLDQERVFTFEYVKRLQKDIDRVKKILKIS